MNEEAQRLAHDALIILRDVRAREIGWHYDKAVSANLIMPYWDWAASVPQDQAYVAFFVPPRTADAYRSFSDNAIVAAMETLAIRIPHSAALLDGILTLPKGVDQSAISGPLRCVICDVKDVPARVPSEWTRHDPNYYNVSDDTLIRATVAPCVRFDVRYKEAAYVQAQD